MISVMLYNYSWNCGIEGITRKTKILALRRKMMKNAFVTMLFVKHGDAKPETPQDKLSMLGGADD